MSRACVIPDVIDALVDGSRAALPDWTVGDGWLDLNTGSWLLWGVEDPEAGKTTGATSAQDWPLATATGRNDDGEINAVIFVAHGDNDTKSCRDEAFAGLAAVETLLRSGATPLAVSGLWKTNLGRIAYTPYLLEFGAACAVSFSVQFFARI